MTHLRPATSSDIRPIAETFVSAVNLSIPGRKLGDEFYDLETDLAPAPPGKLLTRIQEQLVKEQVWVAEVDDRVVGYISWYAPAWKEGSFKPAEITFLFIHPSFHGRGIGSALLKHAQEQVSNVAKEIGAADGQVLLELRCFAKNLSGLRFYERSGFVVKEGVDEWHERVQEYLSLLLWTG